MNQDDVIRFAREVNNTPFDAYTTPELFGSKQIMAFAKLIAKHGSSVEREACAKLCEEIGEESDSFTMDILRRTAAAIRARGQA